MPNPLSWLGAVLPSADDVSPAQKAVYELEQQKKKKQFRQDNPIRGAIADAGEKVFDFLGGATGLADNDSSASKWGDLVGSLADLIPEKAAVKGLALAGAPFAAYGKRLIHGTPNAYDYIDPSKLKEGAHGMKFFGTTEPEMSNAFVEMGQANPSEGIKTGQSLMFKPDAKNVLDLIDVLPPDIHKVIRNMEPDVASRYMEYFNELMQKGKTSDEAYKTLASVMGVPTGVAEKAGFDAVRFPYGEKKQEAWGFPESTPIRSYYGDAPLNPAAGSRPQVAYKPQTPKPEAGDILPSGRRFAAKTDVPKAPESKKIPEFSKKRMSLAELMATETPKKPAEITTGTGKKLSIAEIKALLNK